MAPLIALLSTFAVVRLWTGFRHHQNPDARAARAALAAMLVLTGTAHFASTEAMTQMLPPALPGAVGIIYVTGVVELVAAALLLWRVTVPTPWLGWVLTAFFASLLPANVHSAVAEVGLGGHGPAYLWFRIPLQVLFVGWALVATGALELRRPTVAPA